MDDDKAKIFEDSTVLIFNGCL